MAKPKDKQQTRSFATQTALMHAAERLIAKKGLKNVSIKEIVSAADQKNESALQYHFKSLAGLIHAIKDRRSEQTQTLRAELLNDLTHSSNAITLRELCKLMVLPSFLLARQSADYKRYILSFSHELALQSDTLTEVKKSGGGGASGRRMSELLRDKFPHLDDEAFRLRMESAIRLVSISMGHHARQKGAFQGIESDLFLSNLVDIVEGILSTPISTETQSLDEQIPNN